MAAAATGTFTATLSATQTSTPQPSSTLTPGCMNTQYWYYADQVGSGTWTAAPGTQASFAQAVEALGVDDSPVSSTANAALLASGEHAWWETASSSSPAGAAISIIVQFKYRYLNNGVNRSLVFNYSNDGSTNSTGVDQTYNIFPDSSGSTATVQQGVLILSFGSWTSAKVEDLRFYLRNASTAGALADREIYISEVRASVWSLGICTQSPTRTPSSTPTPTPMSGSDTATATMTPVPLNSATTTHTSTVTPSPTGVPATVAIFTCPYVQTSPAITFPNFDMGGFFFATRLVLASSGDLQSLGVSVTGLQGGQTDIRLALYTDGGTLPGTLLGQTGVQTAVLGWNALPLSLPGLAAGNYWVAVQTLPDVSVESKFVPGNTYSYGPYAWGPFGITPGGGSSPGGGAMVLMEVCPGPAGTATQTVTASPVLPTATITVTASGTPTATSTSTVASGSATNTATPATSTSTRTRTITLTRTITQTSTMTATSFIGTATSSESPTPSITMTPTVTLSLTATSGTGTVPPTLVPVPGLLPGVSRVYPSPARGNQVRVAFLMPKAGQARIVILDAQGKVVISVTEDLAPGRASVLIDIGALRRGIYFYRVMLKFSDGTDQRLQGGRFAVIR